MARQEPRPPNFAIIAVTIEMFNRQPEAYADAATNVRLRLTLKRNPVQIVAEQRELPGECMQKGWLTGRLTPIPL